ncbi:hypothetical protein AKJ16_DCAP08693 [Drosera capensis]
MSLIPQKSSLNPIHSSQFHSSTTHITPFKNPNPQFLNPSNFPHFPSYLHTLLHSRQYPLLKIPNTWRRNHGHLRVYRSDGGVEGIDESRGFDFDAFLSIAELGCLVLSVVITGGCVVNWVFLRQQNVGLVVVGNRVLVWLLTGAVAVGAVIRRQQWRRIGGLEVKSGAESGNMVERIEKLGENLKSATRVVTMLSRQLAKLGTRFRVTKKAMKEPIDETKVWGQLLSLILFHFTTAALCQKNSEATRALALQTDILEKELGEIQKFLLAMQDQQQKQLELILAVAKASKLFEANRGSDAQPSVKPTDGRLKQVVASERIQTVGGNSAPPINL